MQSVTALGAANAFAGFKVVSKISGRAVTQYVIVQPTADRMWADEKLGLSFTGRYAVVTLDERGECTSLYIGDGTRLQFCNRELAGNPPAFAEFAVAPSR